MLLLRRMMSGRKGQALVEMALVLPILLLLLLGVIEFGRIYTSYLIVSNAAREGARLAAVGESDADVTLRVRQCGSELDESQLSLSLSPASSRQPGQQVEVEVTYPVKIYAPIISAIIGDPYVVSAQVTMRVE